MTQGRYMTAGHGQFTVEPRLTGPVIMAGDQWVTTLVARGAEALAQIEQSNRDPLMGSGSPAGDSWVKSYCGEQKLHLYR